LGTNYVAHGDWRTPYAHRKNGPVIAHLPDNLAIPLNDARATGELLSSLEDQGIDISASPELKVVARGDRWRLWDAATRTELSLERTPEGGPAEILVRRWDDWYDYEGSYWTKHALRGIDIGESSPALYAFNVLIGHHGIFSLTPLWLLSTYGCWLWLIHPPSRKYQPLSDFKTAPPQETDQLQEAAQPQGFRQRLLSPESILAVTTCLITIIVVGFYLSRPQIDRNYGGGTCCLRWLIWLTPLWLLTLLPAADRLASSRRGRGIALSLLMVSIFSAFYAAENPWSHPWIFDYWTSMGWINYR
jgi:hypothetical protein